MEIDSSESGILIILFSSKFNIHNPLFVTNKILFSKSARIGINSVGVSVYSIGFIIFSFRYILFL